MRRYLGYPVKVIFLWNLADCFQCLPLVSEYGNILKGAFLSDFTHLVPVGTPNTIFNVLYRNVSSNTHTENFVWIRTKKEQNVGNAVKFLDFYKELMSSISFFIIDLFSKLGQITVKDAER